mgnify:CR=1 FL=1
MASIFTKMKGKPGPGGDYRKLVTVGHVKFLQELPNYTSEQLIQLCNSFTYYGHTNEWYILIHCILFLKLRKYNITDALFNNFKHTFLVRCKYVRLSRKFKQNLLVVIGYLVKYGIDYTKSKDIPYEKFCLIVNALNVLKDDHIKHLLLCNDDIDQTFENIKRLTTKLTRKYPYLTKRIRHIDTHLKFSEGQYTFIEQMYKVYLQELQSNDVVPMENFMLECVKSYKERGKIKTAVHLQHMFSNIKPDIILKAFAEVYPDIEIIAQYPYIK